MDMEELNCEDCGCHIGWMSYAGPHGYVRCDTCHDKEEEARE